MLVSVTELRSWPTRPAEWKVEPDVSSARSTSTMSVQPRSARWYAIDVPPTPPPMITARAWSTTSSAYRWADRRAASCRAVMRSAAGRAAGVRDLTARGQELPVVVERMEREPQHSPRASLLELAVRGPPAERPELPASGPDDDLPDSPRPLLGAGRVLGSEPFVVVVVAVDHEVGMGSVEDV